MKIFLIIPALYIIHLNGIAQNTIYNNGLLANKEYPQLDVNDQSKIDCGSEILFNTDQLFPVGLASDGANFWVSGKINSSQQPNISYTVIHDFEGNFIDTLFVNGNSFVFADLYVQEDTLWAIIEESAELYKIDKFSGEIYDIFQLPTINESQSNNWGITFDGTYLWNSEYSITSNSLLYKIDPSNGSVIDTLIVNISSLLAIEFIQGNMYGINRQNREIFLIDLNTGEAEFLSEWCLSFPYGISYVEETGSLYGISGSINFSGTQSVNKLADIENITNTYLAAKKEGFRIYPNPANDYILISCSPSFEGNIQLFDISGRILMTKIFNGESTKLGIGDIPPGSYYLQIKNLNLTETKRFLKLVNH